MNAGSSLWVLPVIVLSVVVHECAHGLVALWNGDTTARDRGHLTLHPAPHFDPIGTLVVPATLLVMGATVGVAWGRPAPVSHANLRDLRNGPAIVALAGVASYVLLALAFAAVARLAPEGGIGPTVRDVAQRGVLWNCGLAWLNLIPIPPLDGAWVLARVLRLRHIVALHQLRVPALALLATVALLPGLGRDLLLAPPRLAANACLGWFGVPPSSP